MIVDCPHKPGCPGCSYIGVEYAKQLETKRTALADSLAAYPTLSAISVNETEGAPAIEHYRTRVKWMIGPRGEVGLYADGSTHDVVDIPSCRIAGELSVRIGRALRELLHGEKGILSAVDIREIAGAEPRAMVTLVIDAGADPNAVAALARDLQAKVGAIASLFVNERVAGSPQVLGPRTRSLIGAPALVDRVGTVDVIATPGSFVQAHRAQAGFIEKRLVDAAVRLKDELGRSPSVLELYAGSGALGLALARTGCDVTFVESYAPAAESIMKASAGLRGSVRTITEDAETFVRSTSDRFDMVVVDPPRRGLPPLLRAAAARLSPRCFAYVSCDPETFARDLDHLARLGIQAETATPIDMLPLTAHVEALAVLRPTPPNAPPELARAANVVVIEKPAHAAVNDCAPNPRARAIVALEAGVSGALAFSTSDGKWTSKLSARCVVSGVARERGRIRALGAEATYRRIRVVSGHSEIELSLESTHTASLSRVLDRLASFGHAPLGDVSRAHPSALRHAFDARGIDRAMVHVEHIRIARGETVVEAKSELAPDFKRAVARLE